MGQYYRPTFLNKNNKPTAYVYCYDFGSGAKLMEHSWMKNDFVRFVEAQLIIEPKKLVWAGDYADGEKDLELTGAQIKILGEDYDNVEEFIHNLKGEKVNIYDLTELVPKLTPNEDIPKGKDKYSYEFKTIAPLSYKYLINYDKKEFVNKSKVPDKDGWAIHPLPLLTCEGNNRGGGDYRGEEKDLVGRWSRDTIGVSTKKSDIPKEFKEIIFDLTE